MRKLLLVLFVLIFTTVPVFAQSDGIPDDIAAEFQAVLDGTVEAGTPGVVMLIGSPSGTFRGAAGYADISVETAMQPDDAFRIGSITKTFTSVVILQLTEEGALTLDDTIADWLPDSPLPNTNTITIRQLLNHTAGTFNYTDDENLMVDILLGDGEPDFVELIENLSEKEANFAPDEDWGYSNTNYILLGMIIEVATDIPVHQHYRTRIYEPLGMEHTYLAGFEEPTAELVRGYSEDFNTEDGYVEYSAAGAWTAGGIVSTIDDLLIFSDALLAGELFENEETLELMKTVDLRGNYGLGIAQMGLTSAPVWGHTGGIPGYASLWQYIEDIDITVIILWNGDELKGWDNPRAVSAINHLAELDS
jgi:D-alanyl-D-alanine carboxypeptidase